MPNRLERAVLIREVTPLDELPSSASYCVGMVNSDVPDLNMSNTPFKLGIQAVKMDRFITTAVQIVGWTRVHE